MNTIVLLDSATINQIAAGEVIENAASVIKELVENALDAQATTIQIETISSGQGFIAVRDNGIGMSLEDMHLSLERHATSKIREFDDLYTLISLGFRGEALPSIASISKLRLISSDGKHSGYSLRVEGNVRVHEEACSRNRGTCVEVSSLFFNVPARKKFQKTPRSDFVRIRRLLEDMILTKTSVGWKWINDNKTEIFIEKNASYEERTAYVFGEEFLEESLKIDFKKGELSLFGRAGNFSRHRPNRLGQKLFLNDRIIESPLLSRKIAACYGSMLPKDSFPSFIINMNIPSSWNDVNVHPQKKEVRFYQEHVILKTVEECFMELFGYNKSFIDISHYQQENTFSDIVFDFAGNSIEKERFEENCETPQRNVVSDFVSFPKIDEDSFCFKENIFREEASVLSFHKKPRLLKQIASFLLVEENNDLYMIHTVNVRKHLFMLSANKTIPVKLEKQSLLSPLIIDVSFAETSVLLHYLNYFHELCFELDHFGQNSFVINAVPSFLLEEEVKECLTEILAELMAVSKNEIEIKSDDFYGILEKFMKHTNVFRAHYSNLSLLLDCFWAIGKPFRSKDGVILCKLLVPKDFNKWWNL